MSGRYSKLRLALDIAQQQAREATIENNSLSCALEDYKRGFTVLKARAEQAEAMVDWLAKVLTGYGGENEEMSAADWKEAACRAVEGK